ncbi:hypothetical protein [Paraburkholderia sp. 2C]|jgi:hypothetical protein
MRIEASRRNANPEPTRIWIDTEFNGFQGPLISMALVAEDGAEFYESIGCDNPGPWVAQHVMPIIDKDPIDRMQLSHRLSAFLQRYDAVHLIADWPEDLAHFCDALIIGQGRRVTTPPLTMEIRRRLGAMSTLPHNALADARALRDVELSYRRNRQEPQLASGL